MESRQALIWGYIAIVIGFLVVYANLSEMASMAPTSGGQYHWVSEFAPRSTQKLSSFITGRKSVPQTHNPSIGVYRNA
jgi:amino acid transporter